MPDIQKLKVLSVDDLLQELRAREAKVKNIPLAIPREPSEDLREFDDKSLVSVLKANQKVIYGTDDRVDVFGLPAGPNLDDVDSVVALFGAAAVTDNGNGTSTLTTQNFGTRENLCAGERFRDQPVGAFCSGFLVAADIIATAGHCVNSGNVTNARFVFGFRMRNATTAETIINNGEIYRGVAVIERQEVGNGPDWALVRIDRPVINHRIVRIRRTGKIADTQTIHVIGHPSGLPTKFAGGAAVRDNQPNAFFVANLDTYGGNSGSPVFNSDTHEVEGILVRGEADFVQQGTCRVSLVCPSTGCRGEDCTRTTEFVQFLPVVPAWSWANQGNPPGGATISGPVGVLTMMDTPTSAQRPYAFVQGSDGNLWVNWWSGSQWSWANQGNPPGGATVSGPVGVLTMMDTPTSVQRPYAFVQGSDGNLWVNWWNGSVWSWANQGNPPGGATISGPVGVLTMMDTPTSAQRPYVFVRGSDGNLWVNWWNGSVWSWANQGNPPGGATVSGPVGVLTMMDTPTSAQRPYAFVQGSDGNLWVNWWNGSVWSWANQGNPPGGATISGPVGVLTMMDTPTSVQRPYAFVQGSDGNLWVNWWNGSVWSWANQGNPPGGATISGPVGVLTMMDTPTSAQRPYVFVRGSDGNLWVNWWNGSVWSWANQGNPPGGATVSGPVGVLTMMDTPTSAQRPYAFVQGSDGNLWVNWWG